MKCKNCGKYPFCKNIKNPNDEACEEGIKRQIDEDTEYVIVREESMKHNEGI